MELFCNDRPLRSQGNSSGSEQNLMDDDNISVSKSRGISKRGEQLLASEDGPRFIASVDRSDSAFVGCVLSIKNACISMSRHTPGMANLRMQCV